MRTSVTLSFLLALILGRALVAVPRDVFIIHAVDGSSGRGIPLVELVTTSGLKFVTDSAGVAAIREPSFWGRRVFFSIRSHGYRFPEDGFGFRGAALEIRPGGEAEVRLERVNVAERLCRLTGDAPYRDSVLAGLPLLARAPLGRARIAGMDSVQVAPYLGKLFWVWGDTNRLAHPLGHFGASAATTPAPGEVVPDLAWGVDYEFFAAEDGFARPVAPMEGELPVWLDALLTVPGPAGRERLLARYMRPSEPIEGSERGLVIFDDVKERFERLVRFPSDSKIYTRHYACSHPIAATVRGRACFLFSMPFPGVRVAATLDSLMRPETYESYTCLEDGARYEGEVSRIDRDEQGRVRWRWRTGTAALGFAELSELVSAGKLAPQECAWRLVDVETGASIDVHSGSVAWNAYRRRWVMVALQHRGSSLLGEVWFAEADAPEGPWGYARKVVTHDRYSFYNPVHHPFFDLEQERVIHFEGTYANTFSGNEDRTPLYDYNQILYRLRLDDPRLDLPAPVYRVRAGDAEVLRTREALEEDGARGRIEEIVFHALPADRSAAGTVLINEMKGPGGTFALRAGPSRPGERPLFRALPATGTATAPPATALLVERRDGDGARRYGLAGKGGPRGEDRVLCRVWESPVRLVPPGGEVSEQLFATTP